MVNILLKTKICVPPPRPNRISRGQLLDRLEQAHRQGHRLVHVSAPAGYGKTTLVADWVSQCTWPAAWLTLEESENDVSRFLAYLAAALQTAHPQTYEGVSKLLQTPPISVEAALSELVNALASDPQPPLLVLDDYHVIHEESVHNSVSFLLEHLPAGALLVIATRADPPLPLARLRARDQLTELRLNDLRFTGQEAAGFFSQVAGLDLDPASVAALEARTEGWIAGLQMAAASLRDVPDTAGFIQHFTGSHQFVLDYLLEEVLQRQPETIQAFLFETSILDQLCGPLCQAVTGNPSSQSILEKLDHANLFIIPLDAERRWYRYHQLFIDLLGRRLLQSQPGRIPDLHRRASQWYEAHGLADEAIRHALNSQDFERAAGLIEGVAETMLMRSEVITVLGWIERLPEPVIKRRPTLCLYHAWSMMLHGSPLESVEARLASVEQAGEQATGRAVPLRAFVALMRGQLAEAAGLAQQSLENLPSTEAFLRGLATMILGMAQISQGEEIAGRQALEQATHISQRSGNISIAVFVMIYLAEISRKQGNLRQASALYRQGLELASISDRRLPAAGRAMIGLGEILREWDRLDEAEALLREGIQLSRGWSMMGAMVGYLSLVRLHASRKEWGQAGSNLEQAQRLARAYDLTDMDDWMVELSQAWLWAMQHDLPALREWAQAHNLYASLDPSELERSEDYTAYHLRKYEYPLAVRVMLLEKRYAQANDLLKASLARLTGWQRPGLLIEFHLLHALTLQHLGRLDEAKRALQTALALGEPHGYRRIFLDEGEPLHSLLRDCVANYPDGNLRAYASGLLQAFASPAANAPTATAASQPAPYAPQPAAWVEPDPNALSQRELEVLQLLSTSLSVTDMADELFLSVHTVRSHIKSIYAKLGVHNRYAAVAVAQARQLI